MRARLDRVSGEIWRIVATDLPIAEEVNQHLAAMKGKMFRPTLVLLSSAVDDTPEERAIPIAATLEVLHLATLVHDDAVDHSVLRRGMPTINALFSHQVAVIMGDYLYSRAVIELVRMGDLEPLRVLSRVTNEMTVGEMRQLLAHDPLAFSEQDYDLLIKAKTASLMSGACEVGGVRGTPAERQALRRFGEGLGMAFQIVDDVLDFIALEADTGKPAGHDLREHKVTLPLIYALPRMSSEQRHQVERLLENPQPTDQEIAGVIQIVADCGGIEYARGRAQSFCAGAEVALGALPPSTAREQLRASLTFVQERRN